MKKGTVSVYYDNRLDILNKKTKKKHKKFTNASKTLIL